MTVKQFWLTVWVAACVLLVTVSTVYGEGNTQPENKEEVHEEETNTNETTTEEDDKWSQCLQGIRVKENPTLLCVKPYEPITDDSYIEGKH